MVDQIAVLTATTRATAGTQDFTHPDITQAFSAAIFIFSAFTADGADNAHAILGIGFCAPDPGAVTEEQVLGACAQDGLNTVPNCNTLHGVAACIGVPDPTSAVGAAAIVASYSASIAGGVRLNFTTTAIQCKVTVILFAGLTRAYTDSLQTDTVGDSEPVGGTTQFQPDLVIFAASSNAVNVAHVDAVPNIGFALNKTGLPQICAYQRWDDGTEPTDGDGFLRSANAYGDIAGGSNNEEHGTITAFTATGWNEIADAGSPQTHYLALKFSGAFRMACAHMSVAGSTGDQDFNAFGFTPDLVLGLSSLLTAIDPSPATDGALASACGYFVTGRYGSRAYTASHKEGITLAGATVSVAKSRQEDVAILTYDHTATVAQRATWVGASGGGGFRLNFSTATVGTLTALGIQIIPSPPKGQRSEQVARWRARVQQRRPFIPGGHRASSAWRTIRTALSNRWAQIMRAWPKRLVSAPPHVVVPGTPIDPGLTAGDNAMAGSSVGSTAMAGSAEGDG